MAKNTIQKKNKLIAHIRKFKLIFEYILINKLCIANIR